MGEDRAGVSVAEAAAALGITPEAVRKRLGRGTLLGHRVGRTWRVHLDDVPKTGGQRTQTDTQGQQDATDLVTALREEVAWLREEVVRKDQLLAALAQRVPALSAGQPAEVTEPNLRKARPGTSRPWWQFWRRP